MSTETAVATAQTVAGASGASGAGATAPAPANQLPQLTEPRILSIPPHLITFPTDASDPQFGFLVDKLRQREKADPALVESMKAEGFTSVVQAIQTADGKLIGITGRRRQKAAIEAGVAMKALITPVSQLSALDVFARMIRENEIREEDDIFNRAEKAKNYREALLEQNRPQIPDDEALGETKPDPTWKPTKAQIGEANRVVAKAFGFMKRDDVNEIGGKFFELLSLNNVIESVRKAVRDGIISRTELLARNFHKSTPAQQQKMLDRILAKRAAGEQGSVADARAEKAGGEAVLTKSEQLAIAETNACPASVKAFIKFANGVSSSEELGPALSWLTTSKSEVEAKKEAEERAKEELKAAKEQAKLAEKQLKEQQKAQEKAAKEQERAQAQAQKEQERAAAKAAKEAKKTAAAAAKAATPKGPKAPKAVAANLVVEEL